MSYGDAAVRQARFRTGRSSRVRKKLLNLTTATNRVKKKAIITSALPYANGEIHLGHIASTYLPADVTARFLKQNGVETYYVCASDDFGTPILIQSEKEGITPKEYVSHWNRRDLDDFNALNIEFDYFSSTSADANVKFAQDVFMRLYEAGLIYNSNVIQFYCRRDRKFLPDRYVKGACPYCGAKEQYSDLCEACGRVPEEIVDPHCSICGDTPVKRSSEHYFFKLSTLSNEISSWLDGNPNLQEDVTKYVKNWIRSGLVDWDITRDIPWGVRVPVEEAGSKVLYGWFDNHLSYISATVEFLGKRGIDAQGFWNSADVYHFIGKDIAYHHYLFLPAMRLSLDSEFKPPEYIPTRGHLTLESKKISKSRNWYIGLREFLKAYPADYLRFYLASITPYSQDDINFDWDDFAARVNSELIGNTGNFVNRALGFVKKNYDGCVPDPGPPGDLDQAARARIVALAEDVGSLMRRNHLDRALKTILEFSAHFNQYFQHSEPWKGGAGTTTCLHLSVNAVRSVAIALYPFMPGSAGRIWRQLGMDGEITQASWDSMSTVSIAPGHAIGDPSPLFTKIDAAGIQEQKEKLGGLD